MFEVMSPEEVELLLDVLNEYLAFDDEVPIPHQEVIESWIAQLNAMAEEAPY